MRTRLAVVQCLMWLLLSASESELHDAAAADESLLDQRRWRGVRWWNVDSSVQWSPRPLSLRRSTERRGSPVPRGVVNSHQMAALGVCLTCQGAVGLRRSHWQVTVDRSTLPAGSYTPRQTRCWPNCSPRPAHTVTLYYYSATSNNMKLVHWPMMGGLLHLVQSGADWGPPRCTKCNSPVINGQCTDHRIAV